MERSRPTKLPKVAAPIPIRLSIRSPDAGRRQGPAGGRAAASGSGPGRGVLRAAPPLLALPGPPPAEGHAHTAIELIVRHGRGASTAVQTLPMRSQGAVDTLPSIGTHARSVHPRI